MVATAVDEKSATASTTDALRKLSITSRKLSRGSSWKDASSAGSNTTVESDSNSSRPSISAPGRRRSSLASFSSVLKKSKKQTPTVSEEDANTTYRQILGKTPSSSKRSTISSPSTFGERFLDLPAEIQTVILANLPIPELLAFRQSSRSCLAILQANSSTITRNAIRSDIEDNEHDGHTEPRVDCLLYLYPSTYSSTSSDAYFLRTLRRKSLIDRQLTVLLTFLQTRVYMLKLTRDLEYEHFAPYRPGFYRRLYQPVAYIQHFLETIRHLIVRSHPHHTKAQLTLDTCPTCMMSLDSAIASYPPELLVPVYHVLQLLLQHLQTATRSPSSVTAWERKLRGWGYGPPPPEHLSQLVLLGGIQELSKIDEMQGSYSHRLTIVKSFANSLSEAVRINSIAFPDIYKTRSDPVMHQSTSISTIMRDKGNSGSKDGDRHSIFSFAAIEQCADDQTRPITKSLDVALNILTESILQSVPLSIDGFLLGPQSPLRKHILAKSLVKDEGELSNPYAFVFRLLKESYPHDLVSLRSTELRTTTDGSGDVSNSTSGGDSDRNRHGFGGPSWDSGGGHGAFGAFGGGGGGG